MRAAQLEFLRPITASILSERRSLRPFGICGGRPAARGLNLIVRRGGHTVNMGAKNTARLQVTRRSTPGLSPASEQHYSCALHAGGRSGT